MTTNLTPLNVHTRASFVRPAVKETAMTTKIINQTMPYFPKRCVCIAGYLDNSDQFWKVNYHWDLLTFKIDEFLALKSVAANLLACARAIKSKLLTNCPNPRTGYRRDATVGTMRDTSTPEQVVQRHAILKQSKVDGHERLESGAAELVSEVSRQPLGTESAFPEDLH